MRLLAVIDASAKLKATVEFQTAHYDHMSEHFQLFEAKVKNFIEQRDKSGA